MKKTTNGLIFACLVFLTVSIAIAQDKKTAEPTLDEQIDAAKADAAKLKALNEILENNARLRAYNKRLQSGGEVETAKNLDPGDKKVENKSDNDTAAGVKTVTETKAKEELAVVQPEKSGGAEAGKNREFIPGAKTASDQKESENKTEDAPPTDSGKSIVSFDPVPDEEGEDTTTKACRTMLKNRKSSETYDLNVCRLAFRLADLSAHKLDPKLEAFVAALHDRVSGFNTEQKLLEKTLLDVESKKADKQVGSDSGNTGTTNLASGARIPIIFNFAVENGLATQQSNGTTINFRFNPVGFVEMLNKQNTGNLDFFSNSDPLVKQLRRTAFGLSYDTARGVNLPVFTGSRDQLSGISFSYGFLNQREPSDDFIKQEVDKFVATHTAAFQNSSKTAFDLLQKETLVTAFVAKINVALGGDGAKASIDKKAEEMLAKIPAKDMPATGTDEYDDKLREAKAGIILDIISTQFQNAPVDELKKSDNVALALTSFNRSLMAYQHADKELRRRLLRAKLFTFDYNYLRTFAANDMSNFKAVFEKGWETGMDLRFNGGFSIFHAPIIRTPTTLAAPTTGKQQRFRDFAFSGQLDVPLTGLVSAIGDSTLTLGFKWQRMLTDSIFLFDGVTEIKNLKGNIFLGQAKFRVPIFDGFSVPLSFTYSNRPELTRTEKQSRGNFGFTFDLSSLLQRFNPFSQLIEKSSK